MWEPTLITNLITKIRMVSCAYSHTGFIDEKNRVYRCGDNTRGKLDLSDYMDRYVPTQIPEFFALQISCGDNHTAFITPDRKIYVCGNNSYGELHDVNLVSTPTPIPNLTNVLDVVCGSRHTIILVD